MNLSKELKKKRDAEDRLRQTSPTKIFIEGTGYLDLSQFANKNHTHEFLDLTDTPNNYVADKFIKVNAEGDGLEYGDGGGLAEIPQATESALGGIKAKAKTTESSEVAIDTSTGKLYTLAPDEAANGLPAGGTAGQIPSKIDGTDYNVEWIDMPSVGGSETPTGTGREDVPTYTWAQSSNTYAAFFQWIEIKDSFWLKSIKYYGIGTYDVVINLRSAGGELLRTGAGSATNGVWIVIDLDEPIYLKKDGYYVVEIKPSIAIKEVYNTGMWNGILWKALNLKIRSFFDNSNYAETLGFGLIEYNG